MANEDVPRGATISARDTIAREAAAATAQLEQMTKDFQSTPDYRVEQTTSGQPENPQLPVQEFVAAVQDDLQLGIRPELVREFHATGKSGDPLGHVAGEFWMDMFRNDPDMQRRFNEGDATMRRRFKTACVYIAGKHGDVDPAEEAKYRSRLTRGDN